MTYFILPAVMAAMALFSAASPALSVQQQNAWREDILSFQAQIKTHHIAAFHHISEAEFDQQIDTLWSQLAALNEAQIETELMRISRSIGDAHTAYNLMSGPHRHYPLRFKFFAGELRVIDTIAAYQHLLGAKLIAINGIPLAQLQQQLKPYVNYVENQYSFNVAFAFQITINKFLYGTGVSRQLDRAEFSFSSDSGSSSVTLDTVTMQQFGSLSSAYSMTTPQLSLTSTGIAGLQFSMLTAYDTVYLDFNYYPEPAAVQQHCLALQQSIKQSQLAHLVIDLRGNMGGNFYSGLALSSCLSELDQFDWLNGIYVMIDGATQSAAMANASQFKQLLNATLVGQPSGADPNHYMETRRLSLPNSGRKFSVSKRYYQFVLQPTDALYPDISYQESWQAYKNNQDAVLLQLLNHIEKKQRRVARHDFPVLMLGW
ncbi:MAG: peptidase S41 [Gammaproteobacteria bacterium]|nr:peptidase S41 [Gammaproteobacteria bacterium]MBU1554868.1 peptidase S41 [Gammaproteobacteria bacterium]MBU2071878.1 peptidase S41 [Gammaproteobacteria bacterium]MBU2181739.1 peptidase S41 [Gammaproteobacteria bacterium]MBU2206327.1 peptidase S41 [Gammaproteobacteria bacterium]